MKVTRLFGLVLVAVFALSAAVASTASAIPKFKLPITNRGFTALSLTSVLRAITLTESNVVTCTHDQVIGTILNDDEVDARVHFLNCSIKSSSGGPCQINSTNAPENSEGLILTELLRGLLGLLHSPAGGAGILFHPNTGVLFLTLAATGAPCNTIETAVEGSVAGLLTPTGKLQNTANIIFSVNGTGSTGKQEIQEILVLAGNIKPKLTSFGIATSTEESEDHVTFAEAVEVD
jgi:hypothetical protein